LRLSNANVFQIKEHPDLKPTIFQRFISSSSNRHALKLASSRSLFTDLTSNRHLYSVFPLTLRHHPNPPRAKLGVAELVSLGVLYPYPVLVDRTKAAQVVRRTVTVAVKTVGQGVGEVLVLGGGETEWKVVWVRSDKSVQKGGEIERACFGGGTKVVELKRVEHVERMDMG
jgi:hypothetical protein